MSDSQDTGAGTQAERFEAAGVRGFLHAARNATEWGLVLTHGAGANCESDLLVSVAEAFVRADITVLRCDLPFRQQRRFGPPTRVSSATDRAGLQRAVEELRQLRLRRIMLGGHSYGGRQASILASEQQDVCDALLLLSYPLHPPRKPEEPRTKHFSAIHAPAVFVHGTRDEFGSIEEMREAIRLIPAESALIVIEGAGHDLKAGKFDRMEVVKRVQVLAGAQST